MIILELFDFNEEAFITQTTPLYRTILVTYYGQVCFQIPQLLEGILYALYLHKIFLKTVFTVFVIIQYKHLLF